MSSIKNYKFSVDDAFHRPYPSNKTKNGVRYVLIGGGYVSFPATFQYHQYLIMVLLPVVLGLDILTDSQDRSAFRRMILSHIKKFTSGERYMPIRANNADIYLVTTANDIELLYIKGLLPVGIVKRLRSKSDGEMRGAIYEVAIAAAFVRNGYKISWLTEDGRPEFTAEKNGLVDVEAKRRNRVGVAEYNIDTEIRAIRGNLKLALKKKHDNPYMILVDSDMPPKTSEESVTFYERCQREFAQYELDKACLIITNSGYENDKDRIESGKNSAMVFLGKNGPPKEVIEATIRSMHSELPEPVSSDWPVGSDVNETK